MIHKLLALCLLALAVLPVRADWLYWTVDFTESDPWSAEGGSAPKYVWLSAKDSSGNTKSVSSVFSGGDEVVETTDLSGLWSDAMIEAVADVGAVGDLSSYSFYLELGTEQGTAEWVSTQLAYKDAVDNGHIVSSATDPNLTAWTPTSWAAIPEPSSGLLMLIGVAGLALRRRRRV